MPVGYPLIRRESKHYVSEFPQFAAGCRDWIDWLIYEHGMKIQSAFHGGEQKLENIKWMGSMVGQSLNFMVTIGMLILTSFPMKTSIILP